MPLQSSNVGVDRSGVSALEFAIVAPILVTGFLMAFDLGSMAQQTIWLTQATRTGGQYAMMVPTATTNMIAAAVSNALPGWSVTVAVAPTPCAVSRCVKIDVTMPYTFLVGAPTVDLSASYVAPIQ
jgi:Flp pilus assembly protein TadG